MENADIGVESVFELTEVNTDALDAVEVHPYG